MQWGLHVPLVARSAEKYDASDLTEPISLQLDYVKSKKMVEKIHKNTEIFIQHIVLLSATMETLSVRYEDDFIHDMEKIMKGEQVCN